jgi:hypothetical protein
MAAQAAIHDFLDPRAPSSSPRPIVIPAKAGIFFSRAAVRLPVDNPKNNISTNALSPKCFT